MADDPQPTPPKSEGARWLGYLGLAVGLGAVVLTVDSGSVSVMGFSFDVAVIVIAGLAFLGGILAGRFGPRSGDL